MAWLILFFLVFLSFSMIGEWTLIPLLFVLLGMGLGYLDTYLRRKKSYRPTIQTRLTRLVLLHLVAKHHTQQGNLKKTDYQDLNEEIDKVYLEVCQQLKITEHQQRQWVESTWTFLDKRMNGKLGKPPWFLKFFKLSQRQSPSSVIPTTPSIPQKRKSSSQFSPSTQVSINSVNTTQPVIIPPKTQTTPSISQTTTPLEETHKPLSKNQLFSLPSREWITRIFLNFIWQNIGWFIGGFCFVSGSIFLVAYTTGFSNALAIFLILCFYAFTLFWGGYQIRRRRSELVTSSHVLLILGVLLVPLTLTAAVRLIQSGIPDVLLTSLALLLAVIAIAVFSVMIRFASGVIERSLQTEHSQLLSV